MHLKRSRSYDDNGKRIKRARRAASDLPVGSKHAVFQDDQTQGLKNSIGQDGRSDRCSRHQDQALPNPVALVQEGRDAHSAKATSTSVSRWIESLPRTPAEYRIMSQSAFKRPRSASDASSMLSDNESDDEILRIPCGQYKDPRYETLIATKGIFMRNSEAGPLPTEIACCKQLLVDAGDVEPAEAEVVDPIFDSNFLDLFVDLMRQSSELRLCIDLHSRLVPSAEILSLQQGTIGKLKEGCNDRWLQCLPFIDKIPQPDRTVAFLASAFTDIERQKLGFQPGVKSLYAACEGMLFPFLTCEVKAGSEGLTTANRANANSMAIALRGVVDLFRKAGIEQDIHRKILGITITHNASTIELFCHYPEIDGPKTAFYQYRLRAFDYGDRDGQDRYTCYKFVRNIYRKFSEQHLERLRGAIDKLEAPQEKVNSPTMEEWSDIPTNTGTDPCASYVSPSTTGRGATNKALILQLSQQVASLHNLVNTLQGEIKRQAKEHQEEKARHQEEKARYQEEKAQHQEEKASLMKLLSNLTGAK